MDKALKAQWVNALRSGEYRQARERLRQTGAYCCLGVLCTLVPGVEWEDDDAYVYEDGYRCDADGELPSPVRASAGISKDEMGVLICMNDGKGMHAHSFSEIADWIEAHL